MKDDTVVALRQPGSFSDDPLTDILRAGARQLLAQAIEAEVEGHIVAHADLTDAEGRRRVVRHGYLPEREIQTGIGAVRVKAPRVRDRDPEAPGGRIGFTSSILPRYLRRSKSIEELLPWLYLKGISSGEMGAALQVLVGADAKGLSASTVSRLKQVWAQQYRDWNEERLDQERWVYVWADGVYSGLRAEHTKLCALVVIGVNERGQKRFLAIEDGMRESTQSWREVLLKLKSRGMNAPELAIGDGAMGFWAALEEVYDGTRQQRCWMHKTMNVLNCLPKSAQGKAKQALHAIWQAETKADAEKAFDLFIKMYEPKYPKATLCLHKDREELMAFYDFPAQHWQSIRTSNPIESTFATIRHRTKRSKGCLSRDGMLHMMFKLGQCAQGKWRRLRGFDYLAKVITGVKFKDGIEVTNVNQAAA